MKRGRTGPIARRRDSRPWRQVVLERDGHQCVRCGARKSLTAHHVLEWHVAPMMRLEPTNGLTLCAYCHTSLHSGTWRLGVEFIRNGAVAEYAMKTR